MLDRACVQRYMYKRNTVYSIPYASNAQRNMWARPLPLVIKTRCSERRNWCQKKHNKKILKTSKKKAGIAFHYHETGHAIDFENTQIIAEEKHTVRGC